MTTAVGVDPEAFRSAMATVCSQVTVVTTTGRDGEPAGTTVSAFCSLSLEPPMVAIALDGGSRLLAHTRWSRRVAVNLLADGQQDVAAQFATKADDKFTGRRWLPRHGLPCLLDTAGWIAADVVTFVEGGDHVVLFCLVTSVVLGDVPPLVYSHRRFGTNSGLLAPT